MNKRVTIIPSDNLVIVGDQIRKFEFEIDENYHAVQWDGEKGFIETISGSNKILDNIDEFQEIIDAHAAIISQEEALKISYDNDPERIVEYLSSYRYDKEEGGVEIDGITIQTARGSRADLIGARIKAKEDDTYVIQWKTDNGFVTLDAATIIVIANAAEAHVQKCFAAEKTVIDNISNYSTFAEIEAAFDAAYASN